MQLSFQGIDFAQPLKIVNVASVSQLSPFRYPGGKTWLVPFILRWLRGLQLRPNLLVDPFLGGGSVPLSALCEGLTDRLVLREIDDEVAVVWQCIFSGASESLCGKILSFKVSREAVICELKKRRTALSDRAFQTILKNRTYRGGILAKGASLMNAGENGHGVKSRWYPETLARRIRHLAQFSGVIDFERGDGLDAIRQHANNPRAAFFVDPPYTAGNGKRAGRRLYNHSQLDHAELFGMLAGCVGPFLMTYDNDAEVVALARRFRFSVERVPMKNTHHDEKSELVITRGSEPFPH
jgi:DNA adenine methylase